MAEGCAKRFPGYVPDGYANGLQLATIKIIHALFFIPLANSLTDLPKRGMMWELGVSTFTTTDWEIASHWINGPALPGWYDVVTRSKEAARMFNRRSYSRPTGGLTLRAFLSSPPQCATGFWFGPNGQVQTEKSGTLNTNIVPEPSAFALLLAASRGLVGVALHRRRRAKERGSGCSCPVSIGGTCVVRAVLLCPNLKGMTKGVGETDHVWRKERKTNVEQS